MGVGAKLSSRSGARAWYPSGPRLDGKRSSDENYISEPTKAVDLNPQPDNYLINDVLELHGYLIVKLTYPNCTNYEGKKILVFKDTTAIDLLKQKLIDPHFFNDKKFRSPIARFVPTDEGWSMAIIFVEGMKKAAL